MSNQLNPKTDPDQPLTYQIKVAGRLPAQWQDWIDDGSITHDEHGNALLTCTLIDQAALHGLLKRLRDLGIKLISVHLLERK